MKILVIGGGVAGPAFAGFMNKYGVGTVTLVERAPEFKTIGYVIALWGNGRHVLRELDLDRDISEKMGYEIRWNAWENMHAKLIKVFSISQLRKFGSTVILARSDLHKGLIDRIKGTDVRLGTTVVTIAQRPDKKVDVTFSDGKKDSFDLVVGADGIHSATREQVFGKDFLRPYGWGIWVYWLPESFVHNEQIVAEVGDGRLYSIFPSYGRSVAWFVAAVPAGSGKPLESRGAMLRKLFADFGGRAPEILNGMPRAEEILYDDLAYVMMPVWYKDRVVLMGDAQHAASPISGMGTSMALEDAYVLADELRQTDDIDAALARYAARREKRIGEYHAVTERLDRWSMASGLAGKLRDSVLPFVPTSFFLNTITKLIETEI